MSRYIDAELAKAEFTGNFSQEYPAPLVKAMIDDIPTADVEEVRHGRWVQPNPLYNPFCSECKTYERSGEKKKYCSECGARMDGGKE